MEGGSKRLRNKSSRSRASRASRSASSDSAVKEAVGLHVRNRKPNYILEKKLQTIAKDAEKMNEKAIEKHLVANDLTDLVSPYIYDNAQMNILKYILGSSNANAMAALNALNYSGIINTSCPPPEEPWKTESYKNILTGKLECREPIPRRTVLPDGINDTKTCPDGSGDPMAIQKYVDMYGVAHCIRPVVSGDFSCPPKNDPTRTKLKVLKNNVGICVKDPMLTKSKHNLMPTQIVYPDKIDPNAVKYLQVYNDERLTLKQVYDLSEILRKSKNLKELGDIKAGLSGNRHYETLVLILDNIHRKSDINYAQSALSCYLKDYVRGNKSDTNVKQLLKLSGLEGSFGIY